MPPAINRVSTAGLACASNDEFARISWGAFPDSTIEAESDAGRRTKVAAMTSEMHLRFVERALTPRYTFPEASRILHTPSPKLRRWSLGHHRIYRDRPTRDEPLITIDGTAELPLSFLNLIELRFLGSYRSGAPLPAIRRALDYAAGHLGFKRPLLQLEFAVHGRELFLEYAEGGNEPYFVNATRRGQLAWPQSVDFLVKSLDYDKAEHAAYRWWPLGKARPVMLDTRLNAGRPSTAETGVRTDIIALRLRQGWSPDAVAHDLAARPNEIEAARELECAA